MSVSLVVAIEDRISESYERYKSCLRIPEGGSNQLIVIKNILTAVDQEKMNSTKLYDLLMKTTGCCLNTARNTRMIIERANLLRRTIKGEMALTEQGREYLRTDNVLIAAEGFCDAYWGFWEVLFLIAKYSDGSGRASMQRIYQDWKKAFVDEFGHDRGEVTHRGQFGICIKYLRDFGMVDIINHSSLCLTRKAFKINLD